MIWASSVATIEVSVDGGSELTIEKPRMIDPVADPVSSNAGPGSPLPMSITTTGVFEIRNSGCVVASMSTGVVIGCIGAENGSSITYGAPPVRPNTMRKPSGAPTTSISQSEAAAPSAFTSSMASGKLQDPSVGLYVVVVTVMSCVANATGTGVATIARPEVAVAVASSAPIGLRARRCFSRSVRPRSITSAPRVSRDADHRIRRTVGGRRPLPDVDGKRERRPTTPRSEGEHARKDEHFVSRRL